MAVDAEAGTDLDAVVGGDPRVEAIERAHRGPARAQAAEVVDAAVARADEAPGGRDVAHRAAGVHAARGERDDLVEPALGLGVDRAIALAHVDGRLADL